MYPFLRFTYWVFILFFCFNTAIGQRSVSTYLELEDRLDKARKNQDYKELAFVYYHLAAEERKLFNNEQKSFEYYTRALEYYKLLKDSSQIYLINLEMADRYKESTLLVESIDLYKESLVYFQSKQNEQKVAETYIKLSEVHRLAGDFDAADVYYASAKNVIPLLNDTLLSIKFHLHEVDRNLQYLELDKALTNAFDAFFMSESINNIEYLSLSLYYIGIINRRKGESKLAIKYLQNSLGIASRKPLNTERLKLFKELYSTYETQAVYDSAYMYSVKYARLKDSILNKDRVESINNLSLKYEASEKRKEIILLEKDKAFVETKNSQKNRTLYSLLFLMLLLLGLIYYIIRFYKTKIEGETIIKDQNDELTHQKILKLEDELKIKSMQSMIEGQEKERERISKDLHDSMGGLLSTIKLQVDTLQSIDDTSERTQKNKGVQKLLDFAVSEIRSISQNLQPAALSNLGLVVAINDLVNRLNDDRYPDVEFQHYNVPTLDNMVSLSIYRILQEMLTNTIKHAEASEIFIQLRREDDRLILSYEDDGKGFNNDERLEKGMGLENISSRVNYLKGDMMLDSRIGGGASYIVTIQI